ncbi:hypothetical protein RB614_24020 [Phytohabitans sp. ZYX-F-186]|uniref:Serine/threonine protein kinase n=1 Tax=Phytohabitans maris TaxID=3071409 RepID=A0ABU0ZMF4_9ACTN|nr:hypothetical protein [Phytohabitans sp. ZYX-F-186]MDQ7907592.1 hypothetical protein [Phytohabitans sp. ZYX-F-186]
MASEEEGRSSGGSARKLPVLRRLWGSDRQWTIADKLTALGLVVALGSLAVAVVQLRQGGTSAATPSTTSSADPPTLSPEKSPTSSVTPPQPSQEGASPSAPAGPPSFGPAGVDLLSSGTARVEVDDEPVGLLKLSTWRIYYTGDLSASQSGIVGRGGTAFALINATTATLDFQTCRTQKSWSAVINWNQLEQWSVVCIKTADRRRGIMRIDEMPDLDTRHPEVVLTGQIWKPLVNE